MKVQEHDATKNAAPIDDDASGVNNRDQIPTDYYTTNDLNVFDSTCIYFYTGAAALRAACSSI
jgi:hypothetical protein